MNKKEFYEAPEWGTRVVMVERRYLNDLGSPVEGAAGGDETYNNYDEDF